MATYHVEPPEHWEPVPKVYRETFSKEFLEDNVNEEFAERVNNYLADLGDLLVAKNAAYGNSALDPIRVFSTASPVESLATRIDDKISRIAKGHEFPGDDTINDLIGYLVLFRLAREDADDKQ